MKPIDDVISSLMRYHDSLFTVLRHGRCRMKKTEQPSEVVLADAVGVGWGNTVYQLDFMKTVDVVDEAGLELW